MEATFTKNNTGDGASEGAPPLTKAMDVETAIPRGAEAAAAAPQVVSCVHPTVIAMAAETAAPGEAVASATAATRESRDRSTVEEKEGKRYCRKTVPLNPLHG